jgi:glycerol-3-phosphate dehydrogenase (NAD(P)+)
MERTIIQPESVCGVVGYGSWATALVKILLDNGSEVRWHVRNPEVREHLVRHRSNPKYLSQVHFGSDRLTVCGEVGETVGASDAVVFAVPSAFLAAALEPLAPEALDGKFVVSAIKGIVPDGYLTVAEWFNRRYGVPFDRIGIVTGPCHAEEVALERLSYLTMVCKELTTAEALGRKFANDYIRVTAANDIYGVEYAVVLKNIYAIAVGIAHGLRYGDNFLAVLISNAALEMERFLSSTFRAERNVCASAYLGDLLVTCYSQFSRNRTFGVMIGKGYSVRNAQMEMNMVAEGYYAADCIHRLRSRFGIEMPIAEAVYGILYEGRSPGAGIGAVLEQLI